MAAMRNVPKVLIVVASVVGVAAYGLQQPWSLVAALADLFLIALAASLWRRAGRTLEAVDAARSTWLHEDDDVWITAGSSGNLYGHPLARSSQLRRKSRAASSVNMAISATSRVRRQRRPPRSMLVSAEAEPAVSEGLAGLETLVRTTNQSGQRAQLWWFLAGVAASIPAGVLVNLLTG